MMQGYISETRRVAEVAGCCFKSQPWTQEISFVEYLDLTDIDLMGQNATEMTGDSMVGFDVMSQAQLIPVIFIGRWDGSEGSVTEHL